MACDKVVCERWCVKDGVCDKVVCERWCVTKWCVKDGVSKMVCDEVPHCQPNATSAMPAMQMEVNVAKCHTCHAK